MQFQHVLGDKCVIFIKQPLYYWSDINKNSITRKNHRVYGYTSGHKGYVMNFIYSFLKTKDKTTKEQSEEYAFKHLFDIYNDLYSRRDQIQEDNLKQELMYYSYLYYNEVFQEFDPDPIHEQDILKKY